MYSPNVKRTPYRMPGGSVQSRGIKQNTRTVPMHEFKMESPGAGSSEAAFVVRQR